VREIIKLLILKFSPLSCYLVPLRPKYSSQHPQPTFHPQCDRPSFTPIQNSKIIVMCILIYKFSIYHLRSINNPLKIFVFSIRKPDRVLHIILRTKNDYFPEVEPFVLGTGCLLWSGVFVLGTGCLLWSGVFMLGTGCLLWSGVFVLGTGCLFWSGQKHFNACVVRWVRHLTIW
jgi:hypothetical protein